MKRPSISKGFWSRAAIFGALPMVLGLGGAAAVRWSDAVWMTDAGGFWPYALTIISATLLLKAAFEPFFETTSAVVAWLLLLVTWFYAPMWATALAVPTSAAVVTGRGDVHLVRDTVRTTEPSVWLLTRRSDTRIVRNVAGKFVTSGMEVDFAYARPYIAMRRNGDDLAPQLADAAAPVLRAASNATRTEKIALIANRSAQDDLLASVCRNAVSASGPCAIKLTMAATPEAAALGGEWSAQYSEIEAIEERHLPSLVHLLTQTEVSLGKRDRVFGLLLELAISATALAQVAQKSQLLSDEQFDAVIKRILAATSGEDSGDAAAVVASVNRLDEPQRRALRAKAVEEARLTTLLANAGALRLTDAEVGRLTSRSRATLRSDPSVAVRALDLFGDRMPVEAQRDAVEGVIYAKASYALAALERVNFSPTLRQLLLKKVVDDAMLDDFATVRLNKSKLIEMLTPQEMRALIAVAVQRGKSSERWHTFAVETLPVSGMTLGERHQILDGLVFNSPKAALEFVSKNRDFLEPGEVAEVTRDYSRTVTRDFCLHLSHRNKNWKQAYFSETQLQIFRECAGVK